MAAPASAGDAPRIRLQEGTLRNGEQRFIVRGVAYAHVPIGELPGPTLPQRSCLYARDLPLIATMGANTVRTYDLVPEGDTAFLSLIESGGLYWLAGFPLEPFYDPSRPLSAKKGEILEMFRKYAQRFQGQTRLIAYVFGNEVTHDYGRKFAGSPGEFYALLGAAAALLRDIEPDDPPLLTTAVRDLRETSRKVEGLSFWSWNSYPDTGFASLLEEARAKATGPVLISEYGFDAFDRLTGLEDEQAQASAAAALTQEIELAEHILGGVYARFVDEWWRSGAEANRHTAGGIEFPDGGRDDAWFGIFRAMPTERPGFDSLQPRAVYRTLAELWGGRVPSSWESEGAPEVEALVNAASGEGITSPGALVRLTGKGLAAETSSNAAFAWPVDLGLACLCIGDRPAAAGSASDESWIAQVPWDAETGEQSAVLYSAGRASNFVRVTIREYAPAVFPGGVVRAGLGCRASRQNGVRPGETLEVYATGLGRGPFSGLEARINNTPAEVLYAGLLPSFVGLNQANLRVDPETPPSSETTLDLRIEGVAGAPYPIGVADASARSSIVLSYSGEELLLQAGGGARTAEVHVDGTNGYCGPVLFRPSSLPAGISIRAPVVFTGQAASLEVRAGPEARPVEDGSFLLIGHAGGVSSGSLPIRFTVLPSLGDIPVRVVSGGFKSLPLARFDWNGRTVFATTGGGPGRGINVLAVDAATGVFSGVRSFDTWADESASVALVNYLAGLPNGTIVLFAVADDGSHQLTTAARDVIAAMFGSGFIGGLGYQQAWAMIGRKGASPLVEGASEDSQVVLERVLTLPAR